LPKLWKTDTIRRGRIPKAGSHALSGSRKKAKEYATVQFGK
jgi:hypothetical protein